MKLQNCTLSQLKFRFSSNIEEYYSKARESVEESNEMKEAKNNSNILASSENNRNFLLKKVSDLVAHKEVLSYINQLTFEDKKKSLLNYLFNNLELK